MTHIAVFWICLISCLVVSGRNTKVLFMDDVSSTEFQKLQTDQMALYGRKTEKSNGVTRQQYRPWASWRPGLIASLGTSLFNRPQVVSAAGSIPDDAPITQEDSAILVTSAPASVSISDSSEVTCSCIAEAGECNLDFILDPATQESVLIKRLSLQRGWDIPKCKNSSHSLCCKLAENNATAVPDPTLISSCYCVPISASCPVQYTPLQLSTCAGVTCCPAPPTTPSPNTCHCVPENLCVSPLNKTKGFCKEPYTLCCSPTAQTVLQTSSTVNFPTPAPVPLPPNRDCKCIQSSTECPEDGDILYSSDLIDIRNEILCTGLVCCTPPPKPVLAKPTQSCICLNKVSDCPVDFTVIPQFVGPQCGPPRVFCCPPTTISTTTLRPTPITPFPESWLPTMHRPSSEVINPVTEQPPTTSAPGPWCHCTPTESCSSLRVGGFLARDVCGAEMVLCCENPTTPSINIQPLTKCRFPTEPVFPAEGSCSCTTKRHCTYPAKFNIATQGQCPAPLGWCCRALEYCSATNYRAPWLVAIEDAHDRSIKCSALVVHRIAALVPTNCVAGMSAQSLVVRVIHPGYRDTEEISECGTKVAAIIQSKQFSLLLLRNVPLTPEPPFSPTCPPPRISESVDPGDCVLSAVTTARNASSARVSVATSLQPASTCSAGSDEVCVGARRLQFRGDCQSAWRNGAVVLCRVRGAGDRLALMALVTRDDGTGTGVCGGFSMKASATRGSWLTDTLDYLDILQPTAKWPSPSPDNLIFKHL